MCIRDREIARRARGTPRIANRLLRRVRDYAEIKGDGSIDADIADAALNMLHVDRVGLDAQDRRLLSSIIEKFSGGPVGLDNVAAAIGEESGTIEEVIEPYLIQQGLLMRTPRGRAATNAAYSHLGLTPPRSLEGGRGGDAREAVGEESTSCLLYTSPSPRDRQKSRMPSSA